MTPTNPFITGGFHLDDFNLALTTVSYIRLQHVLMIIENILLVDYTHFLSNASFIAAVIECGWS